MIVRVELSMMSDCPYVPVDLTQFRQFVPLLPQNCRLVVVGAKEKGTSVLYKISV